MYEELGQLGNAIRSSCLFVGMLKANGLNPLAGSECAICWAGLILVLSDNNLSNLFHATGFFLYHPENLRKSSFQEV